MQPTVFISYSWSSPEHREQIREWADRLLSDGISVIIDAYDLHEGDDKYVFMESMVTDESVTHVLVFSDREYAEKADSRTSGVGTESQIISREIYSKVKQQKFIPIVCEHSEEGQPYLPVFLKDRIYIDFTSPEKVNSTWEQLVRIIYNKPRLIKPRIGTTPKYITNDIEDDSSDLRFKFQSLKDSLTAGKITTGILRDEFITACIQYADALRTRTPPNAENFAEQTLASYKKLTNVRNYIVDWVLIEARIQNNEFNEILLDVLDKLPELKSRPEDVTQWHDSWFDAHKTFVYETFLYVIASLIKCKKYEIISNIFNAYYSNPSTERYGAEILKKFDIFHGTASAFHNLIEPQDRRLKSPMGELLKLNSDNLSIRFVDIKEAELIVYMAALHVGILWYPHLKYYFEFSEHFPVFEKSVTKQGYTKIIATITGENNPRELERVVTENHKQLGVDTSGFGFRINSILSYMHLDKLGTY